MAVGAGVGASRAAAQASYHRQVDTAASRRDSTAEADRNAREGVRNGEKADRRHREQIAAQRRGGIDLDA